jgi:hypothetical protein
MPDKHPDAKRFGGPGASHENRQQQQPGRSQEHLGHPSESKNDRHSKVSGGGGEKDAHHTHNPPQKGGK